MNNQKIDSSGISKSILQVMVFVLGSAFCGDILQAQDLTVYHSYNDDQKTWDITVPAAYGYLYLEAKGADGGNAHTDYAHYNGGRAAHLSGYIRIGDGLGAVPVGSTLRLIPGQAGGTGGVYGGGGGGTGIAFKGPNAGDSWQLLAVVGGGGGAGGKHSGKPATTYNFGLTGEKDNGDKLKNGGEDGNGGSQNSQQAYPGGGAYGDGAGGCAGTAGFLNKLPTGGYGGSTNCNNGANIVAGGFGFGGGGSGFSSIGNNGGGGGGGGYSGGGSGYSTERDGDPTKGGGPGGGGGSYTNPDWFYLQDLKSIENVSDPQEPQDGYVKYNFTNALYLHLAKEQTRCIDLQSGNMASGSNIQLYTCKASPAQQWLLFGSAIRLAKDVSKCLDLDHSNTANSTNIQLWDCNGTSAQNWIYDVAAQSIRSGVDFNKCLDLSQSNTANGTNIQLYTCNGTGAQKWLIEGLPSAMPSDSDQRIHLVMNPDKCVDLKNGHTANGTNIQLWTCSNSSAQYFTFDGRRIKLQAAPTKCISPDPASSPSALNVILLDCIDNNLQEWVYDGFAKAFRSAVNTSMCLDVDHSNFTDGANIQLYSCNGTDAQQFEIY